MTVTVKKIRPFQTRTGWTPERRGAQAARLRLTRPWLRSTGPRTAAGKAVSAQNGLRHGGRSGAMARVNRALRAQKLFMSLSNETCRANGRYRRSGGDPALKSMDITPVLQRLHHYFMVESAAILRDLNAWRCQSEDWSGPGCAGSGGPDSCRAEVANLTWHLQHKKTGSL